MGNAIKDISGEKFGYLTVIKFYEMKKECSYWLCKCECNNILCRKETIVKKHSLTSGATKSCGMNKRSGYAEISGVYLWSIKRHAKERGIKFDLNQKDLWNLFLKQNKKCIFSGIELTFKTSKQDFKDKIEQTASLDRIDSNKDYTIDNVQWIHKDINWIKNHFPEEKFLNWIKLIYEYKIKNPSENNPMESLV